MGYYIAVFERREPGEPITLGGVQLGFRVRTDETGEPYLEIASGVPMMVGMSEGAHKLQVQLRKDR